MSAPVQSHIVITAAGGPEVLLLEQTSVAEPGPRQILIRVEAAGVNRHDCNQRARGPVVTHSNTPGLEVAGVVCAAGADVRRVAVGDRVCALVDGGGYAQFAVAEEALVLPVPAGMDAVDAASLPEAAFTAWYNLFVLAALQPGESVLIHGGTSGVGVFAIQLLSALGHTVYATCGSDDKCDVAVSLGARAAINYRKETFDSATTRRLGRDIDVVLDMSGGAHTAASLDALAWRGRIVHLSGGRNADFTAALAMIMRKEARITGSLMRPLPLPDKTRVARTLVQRVWPLIGTAILPQVAQVFSLAQAGEAHAAMERGEHAGKIVLRVAHSPVG